MNLIAEPHLVARVNEARMQAKKISIGEISTEDDLKDRFRWYLSRQLGIGFFHAYFDNLTLDMLAFEVFLHIESTKTKEDSLKDASALLKENPKEAEELFSDWQEEENLPTISDEEFLKNAKKEFDGWRKTE